MPAPSGKAVLLAPTLQKLRLLELRAESLRELAAAHEQDVVAFRLLLSRGSDDAEAVLPPSPMSPTPPQLPESRSVTISEVPVLEYFDAANEARAPRPSEPGSCGGAVTSTSKDKMVCTDSIKSSMRWTGSCDHMMSRSRSNSVHSNDSGPSYSTDGMPVPKLLPWWEQPARLDQKSRSFSRDMRARSSLALLRGSASRAGDKVTNDCCLQWCVLGPTSPVRLFWDLLGFVAVMYELLTLPLMAFDYDGVPVARAISAFTSVFWATDIGMNFFVGYYRGDGCTEMRLGCIARRYIRSWLAVDLFVVGTDIALFVSESDAAEAVGVARTGKTFRVVRISRVLRMLRVVRIVKVLTKLEGLADMMLTGVAKTFYNICKMMVGVAIFAHIIACSWYAVGRSAPSIAESWLAEVQEGAGPLQFYVCSYHWTMAQFTPAPVDLHPNNFRERTFTVFLLFGGFVLFSSMLGSTAALINQSREQAYWQYKEAESLRGFFVDNHISVELSSRVSNFFKAHRRHFGRVAESDVPQLKRLPLSLQVELHFEVYTQLLADHPVFHRLNSNHPESLIDICHTAVQELPLTKSEEPFHFRTPASAMYVVVSGCLEYYPGPSFFLDAQGAWKQVRDADCIAEAAMWMVWEHQGLLSATCQCSVLKISCGKLRMNVQRHPRAGAFLRKYAILFVESAMLWLDQGEVLDDLFVMPPGSDVDELLGAASETLATENWLPPADEVPSHVPALVRVRDYISHRWENSTADKLRFQLRPRKDPVTAAATTAEV